VISEEAPTATANDRSGTSAVRLLERGAVWGRWSLRRALGEGGYGEVWLAVDEDGERAAVKFLVNHRGRSRFGRELDLAVRHGGVWTPRVLDARLDDVLPWIAFEYIEHRQLAEVVAESGPMEGEQLISFVRDLWDAVAYLRSRELAHRDLSARNVVLDREGRVRVLDLGSARDGRDDHTVTRTPLALTNGFAAPEQVAGELDVGPAADVWSWGAVTFFAATGRTIHPSASYGKDLLRVPKPVDYTGVPEPLAAALRAALRPDPADRDPGVIAGLLPPLPHEVELRAATRRLEQSQHELEDLRAELDDQQRQRTELEGRAAGGEDAASELGRLRAQTRRDQERLRALEASTEQAAAEALELRKKLSAAEVRARRKSAADIGAAAAELDRARAMAESLRRRLAEADGRINDLLRENSRLAAQVRPHAATGPAAAAPAGAAPAAPPAARTPTRGRQVRVAVAGTVCALLFLGPAGVFATSVEWTRVTTAELGTLLLVLALAVALLLWVMLGSRRHRGWRKLAALVSGACVCVAVAVALFSSGAVFSPSLLDSMKGWPLVPPPPAAHGALVRVDELSTGDCLLTTDASIWVRVPCSASHAAEVQRAATVPTADLYSGGRLATTAYDRACGGLQAASGWTGSMWTRRDGGQTQYACIAHTT
jgi:hypothetical protein